MFCLIKLIGVMCHVNKVQSMDGTSHRENIFCFSTWFKNIATSKLTIIVITLKLCKHLGISLHKLLRCVLPVVTYVTNCNVTDRGPLK